MNYISFIKFTFWILISLTLSNIALSQESSIIYDDQFGNIITLKDTSIFPDRINSDFLKSKLSGTDFGVEDLDQKFEIDIKVEKKSKNKFILEVRKTPITKDIETIIKYLGGWQYYSFKLKRKNGIIVGFKIKYLYSVI